MLDRWYRIACRAALALLVAASLPARADDDTFTVSGVHEDITAANALAARDQAQAEGQAKAFAELMDRVAAGKAPHLSAAEITDLVIGFEVANERTSTVRYAADYTFHFNPAAIRRLLDSSSIAITEAPSEKPVVVLPVFISGDRAVLWDDPNPWRDAWGENATGQNVLPVVVPAGDLPDVAAIDAPKAIAGDRAALKAISSRYQNDDVLVVQGKFGSEPGRFEINAARYPQNGPAQTTSLLTTAKPGETEAQQLARSVAYVAAEIGHAWKQANTIDTKAGGTLDATVAANSLVDWVAVRNRLRTIALVRGADLVSFDRDQIRVAIRYIGDTEQLRTALGEHGLQLGGAAPDWTLALQAEPTTQKPTMPTPPPAAKPDSLGDDPHSDTDE
jgi:hypothetical protein